MWMVVALVFLIGGGVASAFFQLRVLWQGEKFSGTPPYWRHVTYNKKRAVAFRAGVEAPESLHFTIKHETDFDRTAKALGLAEEFQTGDEAFDRPVFLMSDDPRVGHLFQQSARARKAALQLLVPVTSTAKSKYIRCAHGRIWVEYGLGGHDDLDAVQVNIGAIKSNLQVLADGLAKEISLDGRWEWRDAIVTRAALALAVGVGLAVNGAVEAVRLGTTNYPRLASGWDPVHLALILTGAVTAAVILGTAVWLGKSARRHLVVAQLLLLCGGGGFASTYCALRDYNISEDQHAPETHDVHVWRKWSTRHKNSTTYHIEIVSWRPDDGPIAMPVNQGFWNRIDQGTPVRVTVYGGRLEWEWIDRIDLPR